jgi:hypothetical protein
MRNNAKKWSDEEISRLREIMTRYTVDKEGCIFAAQELGRPYSGVYAKWQQIKPNKPKRMSQEELGKILYTNVSKYPGNLSEAFRVTAEQTGKTVTHIAGRYYDKDSPINRHKSSTCFTMISKDKMASNSKNFNTATKTTKQKIKQLIANLFGIKKEDL